VEYLAESRDVLWGDGRNLQERGPESYVETRSAKRILVLDASTSGRGRHVSYGD